MDARPRIQSKCALSDAQALAAELGLDRQRLHAWGLARAVLSGWWDYEDHGHGWEPVISVAEALAQI